MSENSNPQINTIPAIDDGGHAFPVTQADWDSGGSGLHGMSLRDWFAGQYLAGYASIVDERLGCLPSGMSRREHAPKYRKGAAEECYRMADAMIAARKGGAV